MWVLQKGIDSDAWRESGSRKRIAAFPIRRSGNGIGAHLRWLRKYPPPRTQKSGLGYGEVSIGMDGRRPPAEGGKVMRQQIRHAPDESAPSWHHKAPGPAILAGEPKSQMVEAGPILPYDAYDFDELRNSDAET